MVSCSDNDDDVVTEITPGQPDPEPTIPFTMEGNWTLAKLRVDSLHISGTDLRGALNIESLLLQYINEALASNGIQFESLQDIQLPALVIPSGKDSVTLGVPLLSSLMNINASVKAKKIDADSAASANMLAYMLRAIGMAQDPTAGGALRIIDYTDNGATDGQLLPESVLWPILSQNSIVAALVKNNHLKTISILANSSEFIIKTDSIKENGTVEISVRGNMQFQTDISPYLIPGGMVSAPIVITLKADLIDWTPIKLG